MDNFGFIRVAAAVPEVRVADVVANTASICEMIEKAYAKQVSLLVFPELSVTGYTCGDLFGQDFLVSEAEKGVARIKEASRGKDMDIVVGAPVRFRNRLYNCAIVIRNGIVMGIVPKVHIPSYNEFYETRWFSSGKDFMSGEVRSDGRYLSNGKDNIREGFCAEITYSGFRCNISPNMIFSLGETGYAIEICEDLWAPVPPSSYHALAGASIIANLSASNELLMKNEYRKELVRQQSARTLGGYIYCSAGCGESTQDLVFAGSSIICENGAVLSESERFSMESSITIADIDYERLASLRSRTNTFRGITPDGTDADTYDRLYSRISTGSAAESDFRKELFRKIEAHPFVPKGNDAEMDARCREIISIQTTGLAGRLSRINCRTAVVGISGGLDSTLALLVTALAFDKLGWDRKRIIGITMPGYGTTGRTYDNACGLMKALGITSREISIVKACDQHFSDIGHDKESHDVTYENSQARERTQILMDVANQESGIVVGTGDLSELALGWATYNGDHMSMYGVNAGVPKTLVKHLVSWMADHRFNSEPAAGNILRDIIATPISPELLPADQDGKIAQVTEDLVGPYELHDFFLYNFFRFGYSPSKILFLAEKAFCSDGSYTKDTVKKWLKTFIRRFFSQQFKRSCLPDGPKVGSVSLSPRGDWRMPSDASHSMYIDDID